MTNRLIAGIQVRVPVSERSDVGECRRVAQRLAEGLRFDEVALGRVGIVATELATNIVRHAHDGEVLVQAFDEGAESALEIMALDKGPGMRAVELCMRDGYSTGGTAGQGLGAMARLSNTFDVHSLPERGAVVLSRIRSGAGAAAMKTKSSFEFGAISVALEGEIECGDTWRIAEQGSRVSLMMADGLGHGPLAAAAAGAAASAFTARPWDEPAASIECFHRALAGGRGAAAACARLRPEDLKLDYAGVGNIAATVVTPERSRGMASHNGTLGVKLLRNQQFEYEWPVGSWVVMHSDGLSARWSLSLYPGLHSCHPATIAGVLYRDYRRKRDDATVLVAGYP